MCEFLPVDAIFITCKRYFLSVKYCDRILVYTLFLLFTEGKFFLRVLSQVHKKLGGGVAPIHGPLYYVYSMPYVRQPVSIVYSGVLQRMPQLSTVHVGAVNKRSVLLPPCALLVPGPLCSCPPQLQAYWRCAGDDCKTIGDAQAKFVDILGL